MVYLNGIKFPQKKQGNIKCQMILYQNKEKLSVNGMEKVLRTLKKYFQVHEQLLERIKIKLNTQEFHTVINFQRILKILQLIFFGLLIKIKKFQWGLVQIEQRLQKVSDSFMQMMKQKHHQIDIIQKNKLLTISFFPLSQYWGISFFKS